VATVEFGLRAGLPAVAAGCLALVVAAAVPASAAAWSPLSPWAVAAAFWAAQLWHIGRRTGRAELGERPVRYLFGFANTLSLLRSGLYSVVAGLAVAAPTAAVAWLPGLCYGVGVVFDKLDGTVARTVGRETDLGERLDMTVDTAGFIAAPVVAVFWGCCRGGICRCRRHGTPSSACGGGDRSATDLSSSDPTATSANTSPASRWSF
jgi:CDP-diacylglycerol--glycerol-3-phosphate 3-phosphatidyltransferase